MIFAGSDDEERMSLAERASIEEGARQRAAAVAAAGPSLQEAIHTELRGAHAPPAASVAARHPQRQQLHPSSKQPAESGRVSGPHDLLRGGSPTSKVRARGLWYEEPCVLHSQGRAGHTPEVEFAVGCQLGNAASQAGSYRVSCTALY